MDSAYLFRPAFDRQFLENASGRCYDGPSGLVVLDADSEEEARRLMEADPSVRSGVQTAELYPFNVFLARERTARD